MQQIKFFVEGPADTKFLQDYINRILSIEIKISDFVIINANNNTELGKSENLFRRNTESGGVNLLVFDADNDHSETLKRLNEFKAEKVLQFEVFLFPDNKSVGNLETLLLQIINPIHQRLIDCYGSYQNCIEDIKGGYIVPDNKSKVYVYLRTLLNSFKKNYLHSRGKDEAKEENRDYLNIEHWLLDDQPVLEPLKTFLKTHIKQ